ncbi:hypothetical protein F383_00878 [Gossypium arboreum]|uniref:Uncharacterized protein n=1 Tax=Gossypium arboreum TaxID=29729 RepID=A0A0B0PUU2_GOSAR|nr:hypothetical protein F383_21491 [Gossypium arboreum]KHG27176.1 hypothetical protein F383_00878 [Gossypium arboreum]
MKCVRPWLKDTMAT